MKPSDGNAFGPSDGALVATMGGNLDRELNPGLAGDFLPQSGGEGMGNLFTWCEQCGASTEGECLIHGSVIMVSDNKLPSRARLSLPSILSLQHINDGSLREGVFAKNVLQGRTQFGPLEAPLLQAGATLLPGVFDIRVLQSGGQEQLDLSQEEQCNWMMFVRPSQYDQETNLVAYQQAQHIYYISTRVIAPKTELRVWYFPSYGQQFGKEPLPPRLPPPSIFTGKSAIALFHVDSIGLEADDEPPELHGLEEDPDPGPPPSSVVLGVGTRHASDMAKHTCTSCNTTFRSLPLLWDHTCRVLDDNYRVDTSSRPARRKGRPRKVAGAGRRGRPPASSQMATHVASAASTTTTTVLPSVTTLIKTEIKTEVSVPDSTVPDTQQGGGVVVVVARKRGRPKGSKNKPPADGVPKPRKPLVAVKQQRPKLNCHHCNRSFYSKEQHKVHEAEHTGEKPYVCPFTDCGKGFGSSFKFRRHYLVHEQPQDRKCPFCDRKFNRVDHLKNHVSTHNSNRQHWSCKKCGKKYLYHGTFEYHMAIHDAQDMPQLICRICTKNFAIREDLLEHVHTHNRYKPDQNRTKNHKCTKCEKTFTTIKDVRRHMVTHTKDRFFLCDMCPQTFARKDHLRRHKKSNHKDDGLEAVSATAIGSSRPLKTEPYLNCPMEAEALKGEAGGVVKLVDKSQVVLMPVSALQEGGQQQLSLLPQPPHPTAAAITPMQVTLNQHQHQQHGQQQQQQQQQHQQHQQHQQQILLQAGSYLTAIPTGTEAHTIKVIADGSNQYNSSLPVKSMPYRLPPSAQVLATAQPSTPGATSFPLTSSLRQILSNCQPQQQQQQGSQAQPIYSQQDNTAAAASTIMSMLASSRGADTFLDMAAGTGQIKSIAAQWVLAPENTTAVTPQDSAASSSAAVVQTATDSGDHCYATGGAATTTDAEGLKPASLPSLTGKLMSSVVPISDESLRLLQNCQLAGSVGGSVQSSSAVQLSGGPSHLQATWDNISELVSGPFQDMINPMSVSSQPSIINLPVTVNAPVTDGSVSVTAAVTLAQTT
ncbi:hypothetical protein ACOMHN_024644 [Nucella lapillus]